MSKPFLFSLFLLIATVYAIVPITKKTREQLEDNAEYEFKYIFMFGGAIFAAGVRHVLKEWEVPISYSNFCMVSGFLWGIGSLYNEWMERVSRVTMECFNSIMFFYIPPLIFNTAFNIDPYAFFKCLHQILIISGPVSILAAMVTGTMMRLVIDSGWTIADACLFGAILIPIYPIRVVKSLKGATTQTKHIEVLLEGETLITGAWSLTVYRFILGYIRGYIIWWYQFVMFLVREICLGLPLTYLYGQFGVMLMKIAYNDSVGLITTTFSICFTNYYLIQYIASGAIIATVIVGLLLGIERAALPPELDKSVKLFWKTFISIVNDIVFLNVGQSVVIYLHDDIHFAEIITVLITYILSNITRFVSFLVFSPILSRLGYGLSFQNLLICVWSGLKSPFSFMMALDVYLNAYEDEPAKSRVFFLHAVMVYFLMMLINGSFILVLIRSLGLLDVSLSRHLNMNNLVDYIYEARIKTIAILKMDRFLADANWKMVLDATALQHPYRKKQQSFKISKENENEEEEDFLRSKYTFCPDCLNEVLNEPTAKEFKEMTREAKMRLLKLKKTLYWRQFENGMISKLGIRILQQAVEIAVDTEDLTIELDGLFKMFSKEAIFYRMLKNRIQLFIQRSHDVKPPRKLWRLRCFQLVRSNAFILFMNIVVFFYLVTIVINLIWPFHLDVFYFWVFLYIDYVCILTLLMEFFLKICALSWIYICAHGFRFYFKSYWNIIEFISLVLAISSNLLMLIDANLKFNYVYIFYVRCVLAAFLVLRTLRLLKLGVSHCACCNSFVPTVTKYLDSKIDHHRALAFELGKNYIAAEEEILENLNQIIDNEKIRGVLKEQIEKDRLAVTRKLGFAQKESLRVAITVKTKLAMRTVLSSMKEDVNELKMAGWLDDLEYAKLLKSLAERYNFINSIKSIPPPSSRSIFLEVFYMKADEVELNEFLFANILSRKFEVNEVMFKEGDVADAVYMVISGMLKVTYYPKEHCLNRLRYSGLLPVADYIYSIKYEDFATQYIIPGNTVGELSILTGRTYNSTVSAEIQTMVFAFSKHTFEMAAKMDQDPVKGLRCRMWKYLLSKQALAVMMTTPSYRSFTQTKMKYILERAFVPDLSNYKIFTVTEKIEDIILIEGVATDFNSRDMYIAPCYIPRAVQKLILPKSSCIKLDRTIDTKFMILPAKDFDEYEIMLSIEQLSELVYEDSKHSLSTFIKSKGLTISGTTNLRPGIFGMKSTTGSAGSKSSSYKTSSKSKSGFTFTAS